MSKEPYYIVSQDASDFLRHYQMLYEGDYQRKRSSAISALIPNTSTGKVLDLGCGGQLFFKCSEERLERYCGA